MANHSNTPLRIGLVLGSGSARGWAHIGVIRALAEAGVRPDIVCGASVGALVGAAYAAGKLDPFEDWIRSLDWWDIVRIMDPTISGGGFIEGEGLMKAIGTHLQDLRIEGLQVPYGAVATNLRTGREVWLQQGPVIDAVRASIALPGLFTPVQQREEWLVDGGLVNPVPVSLARAMGAEFIIAVNLNGDIIGRHLGKYQAVAAEHERTGETAVWDQFLERLKGGLGSNSLGRLVARRDESAPGLVDVLSSSINIMQDRITRSRMAGDPPDILLSPRLAHLGLMEFDRAEEAIEEGVRAVQQMMPALRDMLDRNGVTLAGSGS